MQGVRRKNVRGEGVGEILLGALAEPSGLEV